MEIINIIFVGLSGVISGLLLGLPISISSRRKVNYALPYQVEAAKRFEFGMHCIHALYLSFFAGTIHFSSLEMNWVLFITMGVLARVFLLVLMNQVAKGKTIMPDNLSDFYDVIDYGLPSKKEKKNKTPDNHTVKV